MRQESVSQSWAVIGWCLLCSDNHVTEAVAAASKQPKIQIQPPPTTITCDLG